LGSAASFKNLLNQGILEKANSSKFTPGGTAICRKVDLKMSGLLLAMLVADLNF